MTALYLTTEDPGGEAPGEVCVARGMVRQVGKRNSRSRQLCGKPATAAVGGATLCDGHYRDALQWHASMSEREVAEAAKRDDAKIFLAGSGQKWKDDRARRLDDTSFAASAPQVVYYVQREDGMIKIGTTGQFAGRMTGLRGEHGELRILLTHRGDRKREQAMHLRFAELRAGGEWFRPGPELLAWILTTRRLRVNQGRQMPGTVPLADVEALTAEALPKPRLFA